MIRWLPCLIILAGCVINSPSPTHQSRADTKSHMGETGVFYFYSHLNENAKEPFTNTGTGFLTSSTGCFWTTYHQYAHTLERKAKPAMWQFELMPLRIWQSLDLVLYKTKYNFSYLPFIKLTQAHYKLQPGELVLAIAGESGHKVLEAADPVEEYVEVIDRDFTVYRWGYRLQGKLQVKDSGSPIVNAQGEAIGVVISGNETLDKITAIPISQELLTKEKELSLCK